MTEPIPLTLLVDGVPVHLSGLRIDQRYQLPGIGGAPVVVDIISVAAGVAFVRGPDGIIFDCPVSALRQRPTPSLSTTPETA